MKKLITVFSLAILSWLPLLSMAKEEKKIVNVYVWSNGIPKSVLKQFKGETGIEVNYSEFDNNETLYAKLKANPKAGYDVIEPSSYYVDRMKDEGMLQSIDKKQIPSVKDINPVLLEDPTAEKIYGLPYIWSTTGIVLDDRYHDPKQFQSWKDLWNSKLKNQILILDDEREAFGIALITLGYSFNDGDPDHLKQAYEKLKQLSPNVKMFASDAEQTIYVDGDVTIGTGWSQDIYLSQQENKHLKFIYPNPKFPLAIDCLSIPKYAPHPDNAVRFINFIMRPDIAKQIALNVGAPVSNPKAIAQLPEAIRNNSTFNPDAAILKRAEREGQLINPKTNKDNTMLLDKYWQKLKNGS
jgi:spermidine/putrescine transport system substrate-binding protein